MTIEVIAFRWVPPFAEGLVRDLRVRWALEEAGLAYHATQIGPEDQSTPSYRALQPFGQVAEHLALDAYVRRCEARPAFQKALADQLAPFAAHATG